MYIKLATDTELVRSVDIVMAQTKRIYISMINGNEKLFFSFSSQDLRKELEHMFSVLLWSHRNTGESLGELGKAVKTLS